MTERLTLHVTEAAHILGISVPHTYRLLKDGSLPSIRLGRRILIPIAALRSLTTPTVPNVAFTSTPEFFDLEKSGEKPFTFRKYDFDDPRFHLLDHPPKLSPLTITITNTETNQSFTREVLGTAHVNRSDQSPTGWIIIHFSTPPAEEL